ncbi:hypothetical protein RSal33209_0703 [Renibacterium salmoninarum ATCC 33209]|uniref:Uncharacterized protein n=1 Tax=Renibacterium salmoninarum (strain ATCC 33209 / DSM 20767 / JCM 11484 / NBRC 15589 / NCIMB 2235) TaxID=288705 RepID=A9WQ24_RENSM|nr:hypothetical protein [Renibacterium salmoninarum]ABY22450.1 hypothetical protein RSal33209_0703 [Renibacterium salmoninarum ATCC 33209]
MPREWNKSPGLVDFLPASHCGAEGDLKTPIFTEKGMNWGGALKLTLGGGTRAWHDAERAVYIRRLDEALKFIVVPGQYWSARKTGLVFFLTAVKL